MSGKRAPKPIEYKDTFEFKLFPHYEYTKLQQKRLRLFQGRVEHYRKIINYADSFDEPNIINLVYVIGYSDRIRPYVQKTKSNVVVLCADIPESDLKLYDEFQEMIGMLQRGGCADSNGDLNELWYNNFEAYSRYPEFEDRFKQYQKEKKLYDDYVSMRSRVGKYFKRYIICDKLHPEKTIAHENLNWIIKRYFPRGREEQGCGDAAARRSTISKAALSGLRREDNPKMFGIENGKKPSECFDTSIKRCIMNINTAIRDIGNVRLTDIFREMRLPPYGWSDDLHAAYCFGYALSEYVDKYFVYDGCSSFVLTESFAQTLIHKLLTSGPPYTGLDSVFEKYLLYAEDGWRLVNRLKYIFGVEERLPFEAMLIDVVKAIEAHTRFPVSVIDEPLSHILRCDDKYRSFINTDLKAAIKYLDWDRCKDIKEKYDRIDDYVFELIAERYPDREIAKDEVAHFCTTEASGWLWPSNCFWEQVDKCVNDNWSWYRDVVREYREKRDGEEQT